MEPILGLLDPEERKELAARAAAARGRAPEVEGELELSVVVPARDEERDLGRCLESLVAQSEPGFALGREWELIVVDDGSTDGTRGIAEAVERRFQATEKGRGVTVMEAPAVDVGPRSGFTGKNGACWAGAQVARGRRILFTDADTVYEAGSLGRSLREAEKHGAELLSYSPRQVVTGLVQRMVMPLIFSELASVYPTAQVNDPGRRVAAANGQFLMVERGVYFDLGGHRAVGRSVLEDVALANLFKRAGRTIRFRYAPEALSAQMYRTLAEMVGGWTKNLALLMPSPVALVLWRVLDVLLFFGLPAVAIGWPQLQGWQRGVIWVLWVRTAFRFYSRVARSHFPPVDVALSILGVPIFCFLLVQSVVGHRVRRAVVWKGRSYDPNRR